MTGRTRNIYLSLGSNLGDRRENISKAILELSAALKCAPVKVSSVIETHSWGFSAPDFLNCTVCFAWNRHYRNTPEKLLKICKSIEHDLGRDEEMSFDADGNRIYHSRAIDIDILFFGLEKYDSETLTIPHKLMAQRSFVMIPLREIADECIISAFPEIFETN